MSYQSRLRSPIVIAVLAVSLGACADESTAPTTGSTLNGPSLSAVKFWEVGSSVAWNWTARELIESRARNDPSFRNVAHHLRILAYLSIAQYNAVVAAENAKDRGMHPSPAAAAAGASVVVLTGFLGDFPGMTQLIDSRLDAQLSEPQWPGERHADRAAGEAIGRAIGAQVVAYAATDGFNQKPAPPNPGGPGNWKGSNPFRSLYGTRTLVLTSAEQFLPPRHPEVGSAEFNAALDEVRALAKDPTAAQLQIMRDWAPRGEMNALAEEMIIAHRNSEREAARVFALANIAGFDAITACFTAKFHYYLIRPWEVDNSIQTRLGKIPHPSYPSAHSCITSAYANVLANLFPRERGRLEAMIEEAGISRIYAGLHYRFDLEAGQELGRQVAEYVLKNALDRHTGVPLD